MASVVQTAIFRRGTYDRTPLDKQVNVFLEGLKISKSELIDIKYDVKDSGENHIETALVIFQKEAKN
ncbi:MAG: sporulation protein Cse60 [Thaumarchaeota archaeon]|nr:sporulation protein Cse60 [Nitrososphaerota archaeon]